MQPGNHVTGKVKRCWSMIAYALIRKWWKY